MARGHPLTIERRPPPTSSLTWTNCKPRFTQCHVYYTFHPSVTSLRVAPRTNGAAVCPPVARCRPGAFPVPALGRPCQLALIAAQPRQARRHRPPPPPLPTRTRSRPPGPGPGWRNRTMRFHLSAGMSPDERKAAAKRARARMPGNAPDAQQLTVHGLKGYGLRHPWNCPSPCWPTARSPPGTGTIWRTPSPRWWRWGTWGRASASTATASSTCSPGSVTAVSGTRASATGQRGYEAAAAAMFPVIWVVEPDGLPLPGEAGRRGHPARSRVHHDRTNSMGDAAEAKRGTVDPDRRPIGHRPTLPHGGRGRTIFGAPDGVVYRILARPDTRARRQGIGRSPDPGHRQGRAGPVVQAATREWLRVAGKIVPPARSDMAPFTSALRPDSWRPTLPQAPGGGWKWSSRTTSDGPAPSTSGPEQPVESYGLPATYPTAPGKASGADPSDGKIDTPRRPGFLPGRMSPTYSWGRRFPRTGGPDPEKREASE